jgi:hypothetical protein
VALVTGRGPVTATRRRTWWAAPLLFVLGSCVDAALAPSGTLCGCILVALWLAVTAPRRLERAGFVLAVVACTIVTLVCVADASVSLALARNDGATARTMTLGALLVLAVLALPRHVKES